MSDLRIPNQTIQPFNVLAFDPGGTTGWAHACLGLEYAGADSIELKDIIFSTGEFSGSHHQDIYALIRNTNEHEFVLHVPQLEIVSEPFHYRQNVVEDRFRGKVELISAEYIGVIRLACAQLGLSYYDRFTPGEAKRWCTDKKLQRLGWFQTPATPMRHRNDALRQLVKYLIVKLGVRHPLTSAWRTNADSTSSN